MSLLRIHIHGNILYIVSINMFPRQFNLKTFFHCIFNETKKFAEYINIYGNCFGDDKVSRKNSNYYIINSLQLIQKYILRFRYSSSKLAITNS
jgi:hypothetical protein